MSYTPGPWHTEEGYTANFVYKEHVFIAEVREEANARLIALAPRLVEALEHVRFWEAAFLSKDYGVNTTAVKLLFKEVRQVLAEVKGEGNDNPAA